MKTKALARRIFRKGNLFPAAIAAVFTGLAARIAYVRQFPLPYDERYHVGLIKLYSHHLNPFMGSQPAGGDAYGAVARDPSYLYHYLMSFPYRLFDAAGLSNFGQIIALRTINIALGLLTLYFMYRLGRRVGLSPVAARLATLALALTPVFYDVAAQVNYDNLLILVRVLAILAVLQLREAIRARTLPFGQLAYFAALLMAGTLVKYSFLPIVLIAVLYIGWQLLRHIGLRSLPRVVGAGFSAVPAAKRWVLLSVVFIAAIAWVQRYGVNLVLYHTPHPQCHVVLSVQECQAYSPWARNYQLHASAASRPGMLSLRGFTVLWARLNLSEIVSVVYDTPTQYGVYAMNVPLAIVGSVALAGAVLIWIGRFRQCIREWIPVLLMFSSGYALCLWGQNYSDYKNLHEIVAVQGRYLLPVLPIVYTAVGLTYAVAFASFRAAAAAGWIIQLRHRVAAAALQFSNALSFDGRLQTWPPSDGLYFELTEWTTSKAPRDK